jgi:hypothetical protein
VVALIFKGKKLFKQPSIMYVSYDRDFLQTGHHQRQHGVAGELPEGRLQLRQGSFDATKARDGFLKYFCRKIQLKNWRFCLKTKPNFEKS